MIKPNRQHEIIILGNSLDDKGTQLENLAKAILANLGYTEIVASEIGAGGFEVDVTAEFKQPEILNNYFTLNHLRM